MREILFRGKRLENGEWIYGYYAYIGPASCKLDYIIPEYASALYTIEIIQKTAGRYTGMVDKNKTRIFEGDIVRSTETGELGIVQWYEEHAAFLVWCPSPNQVGFLYECASIVEIVGNIHDNRDIPKETQDD